MVEKPTRYRIDDAVDVRGDEWEVFCREGNDRLRHVGSLVASDPDEAHETATRLFAWYAEEVWVCRSADVARYATAEHDDAPPAAPATPTSGDEERSFEETEVEGPEG